jgi:7-keto-8-aminopelargonate synthetase-like enzyme
MSKARSFFSRGRKVQTVERLLVELERNALIRHRARSGDGAEWVVDGRRLRNFASCSYMGLERHPHLVDGAITALEEYGSNFSISRAYLECSLYRDLEDALDRMTGRYAMVAPSTTLAHLAALPVLVGDRDLVLIDQFAHASLHMATDLVADVPIELLRHSRMDLLEKKLLEAGDKFERVWYLCDGVYSMLGDFAPFEGLADLLRRYPKLNLYVDDAHAVSWIGQHGRGAALAHLGAYDRVVAALSLNKAFGAVGGALALPSEELRERVRRCGGPMLFSGPIAPAGLGAGLASARLHLTSEFEAMQEELRERVAYARTALEGAGLPLATGDATPILVVHYDSAPIAQQVVGALRERGFFTCISTFPAVPINKPSLRFTISRHNSLADIQAMVEALLAVSAKVPGAFARTTPPPDDDGRLDGLRDTA